MAKVFTAKADTPGESPPRVSGKRETSYFDKNAAQHERAMAEMQLGYIGKIIGGPATVATLAALMVIAGCFLIMLIAVWKEDLSPSAAPVWARMFDASLGSAGTALGFLFGRGTSSDGK